MLKQFTLKTNKCLALGSQYIISFGNRLSKHSFIASLFICSIILIIAIKILFFQLNGYFEITSASAIKNLKINHDLLLNETLGVIGMCRISALFLIGIIAPLILFISNWQHPLMLRIMNPYFLLIGAQAGSMFAASTMLGPGAVTFIGLFYSLFRSVQVLSLQKNITTTDSGMKRSNSETRFRKYLRLGLLLEFALWALNVLYLFIFISLVTWGLIGLGLKWNWPS